MSTTLLTYLSQVPDPRRPTGIRHPLSAVLAMVIMGNLSGAYGYRELARFMQRHAWTFVGLFGFKHGVPAHSTLCNLLGQVDFAALKQQFEAWMHSQEMPGQTYAVDGKSLRSTLQHYSASYQDFVAMVQVFSHQSGLVAGVQAYQNGQQGEAHIVRLLIEQLDLKGALFTLDALHCQKKH